MSALCESPLVVATISFGDFLKALLRSLDEHCVRACVLRNHEEFSARNTGRDLDLLIHRS